MLGKNFSDVFKFEKSGAGKPQQMSIIQKSVSFLDYVVDFALPTFLPSRPILLDLVKIYPVLAEQEIFHLLYEISLKRSHVVPRIKDGSAV